MDQATTPLADVIDAYLADGRHRRLRPATLRYYDYVLRRFAAALGAAVALREGEARDGAPALGDVTLVAARAYQDACLEALKPQTVANYVVALRTFGVWLEDEEYVAANPLARLRTPKVDRDAPVTFSDGQLAALLRASTPAEATLVAFLATTGVRIGEACRLDLEDVSAGLLAILEAKNRHGRVVPLDAALGRLLRRYVREVRPAPADPEERALFLTRRGTRMTENAVRHMLKRLARRSGVTGVPVSPHRFRHWFAHDLVMHGTHPAVLAARGGWKAGTMIAP